ncbi:MAG: hypothetical protein KFB94_07805 [Methylophilaceae bacterium]|nr:MAG: hypothetical protein KFB94_07805 [Methylophilaceae bacterium]
METKRIFAIIGMVVGVIWAIYILVGWAAYNEMNQYNTLAIFKDVREKAFVGLMLQTIIDFGLILVSAILLKPTTASSSNWQEDSYDLNSDSFKIFLTKKYGIEKNEALGKVICNNQLFNTIDEALKHAGEIEQKNQNSNTTLSSAPFIFFVIAYFVLVIFILI